MGLEKGDLTQKGAAALKRCKNVFVENYTSFPYEIEMIHEKVGRKFVEEGPILELAKIKNVALLIPGDPLFATTHISLLKDANDSKIPVEVIHAPSIINTISKTGLSPYKLGRIITLSSGFESNFEKLEKNQIAKLHTLCLLDPEIDISKGLTILKKFGIDSKIISCEHLGMKSERIHYGSISELQNFNFDLKPQCIIIPSSLQFYEEEFLEQFKCK